MALKLIANYSKRLGLPGYSSHQFSICIESEIGSSVDISDESARLYETLQQSVDEQIQQTGFVPQGGYGQNGTNEFTNGRRDGNGSLALNGHRPGRIKGHNLSTLNGQWQCSQKQQDLILKLIDDNQLNKHDIEAYASEQFGGKGVKHLGTKEASALIEYIFTLAAPKGNRGRQPAGEFRP